jgi:hypothetical protein
MRYEDSYIRAFPFDKLVDGMVQPEMILETVDLMMQAVNQGVLVNVIINNRAGGNAPLLAQLIAGKFLQKIAPAQRSVEFLGGLTRFQLNNSNAGQTALRPAYKGKKTASERSIS